MQAYLGYGLDVVRVRAFNHLGPGQTNRFVAPAIAERIALNEFDGTEVVPVGNLTPRRDFTDVRDVVRAYRLLMTHGEAGEAYNVCSGVDIAISELADQLVAHGPPAHAPRGGPAPAARRSRSPCCAATRPSCTRPPAGSRRSRSAQTLADLLAEWRERVGP